MVAVDLFSEDIESAPLVDKWASKRNKKSLAVRWLVLVLAGVLNMGDSYAYGG
jgi:hypothetical protein